MNYQFQARVRAWVLHCFGQQITDDMTERSFRFLEESLELVQSVGCTKEQAQALIEYVYARPSGDTNQEIGGVMVTLAAFCAAANKNMDLCAEYELLRVNMPEMITKIRNKQAAKRVVVSHASQAALPGEWNYKKCDGDHGLPVCVQTLNAGNVMKS